MSLTAENTRVAVTGGLYHGVAGTPIPTDATTALNIALKELGYLTEDGVTQTIDEDTETIRAWQNGETVRVVQTSHEVTYEFSLLETSALTLETYYGNHTVDGGAGTTQIKAGQGKRGRWVLHVIDGIYKVRIVVPDGQVTERGDIEYVNGNAIMYPLTVTCYPDSAGVKAYLYTAAA